MGTCCTYEKPADDMCSEIESVVETLNGIAKNYRRACRGNACAAQEKVDEIRVSVATAKNRLAVALTKDGAQTIGEYRDAIYDAIGAIEEAIET